MDYNPWNIALAGEQQGEYLDVDARALRLLGDRVRLQASSRPSEEAPELARIARRSNEPQLAYATDEDADFSGARPADATSSTSAPIRSRTPKRR